MLVHTVKQNVLWTFTLNLKFGGRYWISVQIHKFVSTFLKCILIFVIFPMLTACAIAHSQDYH